MAGHSKWATTKHHKAAQDQKKGKLFTQLAKRISVAARLGGGDPQMNSLLTMAIEKARKASMPNENITRAIKTGTGELGADEIFEVLYEGYGPSGAALMIQTLTNNKNRTVANLRHLLEKHGGSLGSNGAVAWMFLHRGIVTIDPAEFDPETISLQLIDFGAEDVDIGQDQIQALVPFDHLSIFVQQVTAAGLKITDQSTAYLAQNRVTLTDPEDIERLQNLLHILDEDEDVEEVYCNADIADG